MQAFPSSYPCLEGPIQNRIILSFSDSEAEQEDLAQSLGLVKDVIGAVNSKVASYEKKVRLNEIYTKTDSKSIMRMKSGQMFAKEDLKRKKLVRDGGVFLKSAAGRLKGEAHFCLGLKARARGEQAESKCVCLVIHHQIVPRDPCPHITQKQVI